LAARLVDDWRVVADAESLSDHRYIEMVSAPVSREVLTRRREAKSGARRWALKKLEEDALFSSILAALWEREGRGVEEMPLVEEVRWIRGVMQDACDASMARIRLSSRKAAYWWTEEIAELRRSSVHQRRLYDRARRARNSRDRAARLEEALEAYNAAKQELRAAIKAAKARIWEELLLTLD